MLRRWYTPEREWPSNWESKWCNLPIRGKNVMRPPCLIARPGNKLLPNALTGVWGGSWTSNLYGTVVLMFDSMRGTRYNRSLGLMRDVRGSGCIHASVRRIHNRPTPFRMDPGYTPLTFTPHSLPAFFLQNREVALWLTRPANSCRWKGR